MMGDTMSNKESDIEMWEVKKKAEHAWEQLSMADNFIFHKIMQNRELCRKVLSEILGMKITRVEYPEYEKTIDIRYDSKSIRLDVYVKDEEDTVYNVEIQNVNTDINIHLRIHAKKSRNLNMEMKHLK